MNILIVGSGGREHAIAWKMRQSSQAKKIYCAPGNGGMAKIANCVDIGVTEIDRLVEFAKEKDIGLTVVGPEAPLVEGIVDVFEENELTIFGPSQAAAYLEGSKVFSKEFMVRNNIPTADFRSFEDLRNVREYLAKGSYDFPLVVKADGLAAGKGVVICKTLAETEKAVSEIMVEKVFKDAGNKIIIEECLQGEEVSILAISDGENYVILEGSQDHKRLFDDDMGPNTGGMGAYSPAPLLSKELLKEIEEKIIEPTIRGMNEEGTPFKGVLYAGLMITKDGPKTLEYNVRFGDPETQVVLPRLKNDLVELMYASCTGQLNDLNLFWDERDCVSVVMASGGYPREYEKGFHITGLDEAEKTGAVVFHAGTKLKDGKIFTTGGRVLNVTGFGKGIDDAIKNTYDAVDKIQFDHAFFRRDIGAKALRHINLTRR